MGVTVVSTSSAETKTARPESNSRFGFDYADMGRMFPAVRESTVRVPRLWRVGDRQSGQSVDDQ